MALMTPEQFENSLKQLKPRVFMNGKPVESILENKNTRTVVEANKASYAWALDPIIPIGWKQGSLRYQCRCSRSSSYHGSQLQ